MPPSARPSSGSVQVVLVEDHDMVAEAIGLALDQAEDIEVVARSRSMAAALADTRRCRPDVVVLDRRLSGRIPAAGAALTARERETLVLLAEGASTVEIGTRLGIAHNTTRNHVQRVLDKLGARSKLEAVATARREGLLD